MSRRWGIPIQGSKNKIAEWVISVLPPAEHLYDVFCGGGAITHCALMSGKWDCVHFSDISDTVTCVRDLLEGNIPDGSEWISRDEFYRRRDTDPWVRLLWSFSNNQRDYLYSRKLEPYKKAVHEMIFAPTPTERRLKFREVCRLIPTVWGGGGTTSLRPRILGADSTNCPPRIQNLQHMEGLQSICSECSQPKLYPPPIISDLQTRTDGKNQGGGYERLQSEERRKECEHAPFCRGEYECRIADYRDIEILPDSVIYADIPYKGVREYRNDVFDHEAFEKWATLQESPVFISEYKMDETRFFCIAQRERTSTFSATNNSLKKVEKLFIPMRWKDWWLKRNPRQQSLFD